MTKNFSIHSNPYHQWFHKWQESLIALDIVERIPFHNFDNLLIEEHDEKPNPIKIKKPSLSKDMYELLLHQLAQLIRKYLRLVEKIQNEKNSIHGDDYIEVDHHCPLKCVVYHNVEILEEILGQIDSVTRNFGDDNRENRELDEMIDSIWRRLNIPSCFHLFDGDTEYGSCKHVDNCPFQKTMEKVSDLLKKIKQCLRRMLPYVEVIPMGVFVEPDTIVLYVNEIRNFETKYGLDRDKGKEAVFAHELFHAFHFYYCQKHSNPWNYSDYSQTVTVESLARFFELHYISKTLKDKRQYKVVLDSTKEEDVDYWPYSGAKYLIDEKNNLSAENYGQPEFRFRSVFYSSLSNWKLAYDQIMFLRRAKEKSNKKPSARAGMYDTLRKYLEKSTVQQLSLTFSDVEKILGNQLCDSARKYRAYWAPGNVLGRTIIQAHYEVSNVDFNNEIVKLTRI